MIFVKYKYLKQALLFKVGSVIQKKKLFLKRKFKLQAAFLLITHTDGSAM